MAGVNAIIYLAFKITVRDFTENNKFYFHFIGDNTLYINIYTVTRGHSLAHFRKTCQIWCKLYKNSIIFYAAHYSRSGGKGGV